MLDNVIKLFNDQIWLTQPSNMNIMIDVLLGKLNNSSLKDFMQIAGELETKHTINSNEPFITKGGVGVLPIQGQLVPKCSQLDAMCGFSSTHMLREAFLDLENSNKVEKIALDVDCVGGAVTGCFEFAEVVKNSTKEVAAFTENFMCSGGYLVSSGAKIYASPTAYIGSLGCVHSIIKRKPDDRFESHIFQAGAKKAYGNPDLPMTKAESDHFQKGVDDVREMFVSIVSDYRGIDKDKLLKTEAEANYAMKLQFLVDEIVTKETFVERFF